MALSPLMIHIEGGSTMKALFNPEKLQFAKSVSWSRQEAKQRDNPELQFQNGQPRTLNIDLFLDTYDSPAVQKMSVAVYTEALYRLILVEGDRHRPPVCKLSWGRFGVFFQGVVEKMDQQFTLFMEDGTPVRATCRCTFKEWRTNPTDQRRQNPRSSDIAKQRIVRRGDTLSSIAAEEYRDSTLWRPIADENGIDDPLNLRPGTKLLIPILTHRASKRTRS